MQKLLKRKLLISLITGFVTKVTRWMPLVEQNLPTLPEYLSSPLGFQVGLCYSIFSFMCLVYISLFVILSFFCWPLCCLSFFDRLNELGIWITQQLIQTYHQTNTAWVHVQLCKLQKGCTRLATASDKVYQLLSHGRCFSLVIPASSTTKTGRRNIAEILLNTKHQSINPFLIYGF